MPHFTLKIDLARRTSEIEEIPREIVRKYIGGRGLGAYLLYRSVPAQADPLGEENHLLFTAGPASGTGLYYSSKVNLTTKSPLTGIYLNSVSGGTLASQMRRAGFWALDIHGVSERPVYLAIKNQEVFFRDAADLWGMETAAAQKAMLGVTSPKEAATVSIGPAGEKLNLFAAPFSEGPLYRCFGRGGGGAVMGSKKLKGFIVQGTGDVMIADKERYNAVKKSIAAAVKNDLQVWAKIWRRYETGSDLGLMHDMGILPTRNWRTGQFAGWEGIDKSRTPMGWPEKGRACGPYCLTPGCRDVEVTEGPYKGARSDLEWETIYSFGTTCGVNKMEPIIAASQICDEYGVDTMTAGITIGFAMECFEEGLITEKDTDGLVLNFGNHESMIAALKKMVRGEGFGKQLAKGTKRLSEEIAGSEAFAMQVKGLELGGYECRGLNGQALQFAVDNRGGCHKGYGLQARNEIMDGTRLAVESKGEYVKDIAVGQMIRDSFIICSFSKQAYPEAVLSECLSSLDGESWSGDALREAAVRIMCHERLFNMREGISRKDDSLPTRLLKEPKPDGPTKGEVVPLEALKDSFYRAMGYDLATGNPPDALLAKMGINK